MSGMRTPKRSKWQNRAGALALFLALGFVMNMGVAWGIAAMLRNWYGKYVTIKVKEYEGAAYLGDRYISVKGYDFLTYSSVDIESSRSIRWLDERFQLAIRQNSTAALVMIPSWTGWSIERAAEDAKPISLPSSAAQTLSRSHDAPEFVWRMFMSTGFPRPAVRWTAQSTNIGSSSQGHIATLSNPINAGSLVLATKPPFLTIGGDGYPIRPIWPGAFLNSAFYGLLLFGVWRGCRAIRSRGRRRHGRCARCSYSLAGLAVPACPECGHPVPLPPAEGALEGAAA